MEVVGIGRSNSFALHFLFALPHLGTMTFFGHKDNFSKLSAAVSDDQWVQTKPTPKEKSAQSCGTFVGPGLEHYQPDNLSDCTLLHTLTMELFEVTLANEAICSTVVDKSANTQYEVTATPKPIIVLTSTCYCKHRVELELLIDLFTLKPNQL